MPNSAGRADRRVLAFVVFAAVHTPPFMSVVFAAEHTRPFISISIYACVIRMLCCPSGLAIQLKFRSIDRNRNSG